MDGGGQDSAESYRSSAQLKLSTFDTLSMAFQNGASLPRRQ
jgi:hypothetical protein